MSAATSPRSRPTPSRSSVLRDLGRRRPGRATKPFVLVFATPKFCASPPSAVRRSTGSSRSPPRIPDLTFINVEPYELEAGRRAAPAGPHRRQRQLTRRPPHERVAACCRSRGSSSSTATGMVTASFEADLQPTRSSRRPSASAAGQRASRASWRVVERGSRRGSPPSSRYQTADRLGGGLVLDEVAGRELRRRSRARRAEVHESRRPSSAG